MSSTSAAVTVYGPLPEIGRNPDAPRLSLAAVAGRTLGTRDAVPGRGPELAARVEDLRQRLRRAVGVLATVPESVLVRTAVLLGGGPVVLVDADLDDSGPGPVTGSVVVVTDTRFVRTTLPGDGTAGGVTTTAHPRHELRGMTLLADPEGGGADEPWTDVPLHGWPLGGRVMLTFATAEPLVLPLGPHEVDIRTRSDLGRLLPSLLDDLGSGG